MDHQALQEMVRRSGQMGVPVIIVGDEVIVGFDRPRLERLAVQHAGESTRPGGPRLGLRVRDAPGGGVEVGGVRAGSLGERLGVQAGDVIEAVSGQPVRTVADLERLTERLQTGQRLELTVRRQGRVTSLTALR